MKVAAAQISCGSGEVSANLRKIREYVSRAKENGVELIVFPEMSDTGYSISAIQKHASSWNEGAVPRLQEIARQYLPHDRRRGVGARRRSHLQFASCC